MLVSGRHFWNKKICRKMEIITRLKAKGRYGLVILIVLILLLAGGCGGGSSDTSVTSEEEALANVVVANPDHALVSDLWFRVKHTR